MYVISPLDYNQSACLTFISFLIISYQVINSQKDGVFSPACFMHAFSGENLTNAHRTLACEISGKLPNAK